MATMLSNRKNHSTHERILGRHATMHRAIKNIAMQDALKDFSQRCQIISYKKHVPSILFFFMGRSAIFHIDLPRNNLLLAFSPTSFQSQRCPQTLVYRKDLPYLYIRPVFEKGINQEISNRGEFSNIKQLFRQRFDASEVYSLPADFLVIAKQRLANAKYRDRCLALHSTKGNRRMILLPNRGGG
jgi:hypothetical protein